MTDGAEQAFPANFSAIRERILVPRCTNCHAGLASYKNVMDELIVPGSPDTSKLYNEVKSGKMPRYSPRLRDAELNAISNWITAGAKND